MTRRRVLLVINTLTYGGAEAQAVSMARAIKSTTLYEPVIIGLSSGGPLEELLARENILYDNLKIDISSFYKNVYRKVKLLLSVAKKLRNYNPVAIISSTYYPNLIINLACYFIPGVRNCWYQVGKEWDIPISKSLQLALSNSKKVIANSTDVKDYLINRLNIKKKNIGIIPQVYFEREASLTTKKWKEICGLYGDEIVIIITSNFFKVKDQGTALEAMGILSKKFPLLRIILSGFAPEPNYLNSLKALAFDLKLNDKVIFLPSSGDVFGLLQIANIGLFTSVKKHTEGSPTTILEYMFSGLPVVASKIACNEELFEGLNSDFLYEPENVNDLVLKLTPLILDSDLRNELGTANRQKAIIEYNPVVLQYYMKEIIT